MSERQALCEAAVPHPDFGLWLLVCSNPATEIWEYGCVHEHIRRRGTCDEHRPGPGLTGCRTCLELGHACEMTARFVERFTVTEKAR